MPLIQLSIVEGRSPERKRAMIERVTDAVVETLEVEPAQVRVLIYEVPPAHWAIGGRTKEDA